MVLYNDQMVDLVTRERLCAYDVDGSVTDKQQRTFVLSIRAHHRWWHSFIQPSVHYYTTVSLSLSLITPSYFHFHRPVV